MVSLPSALRAPLVLLLIACAGSGPFRATPQAEPPVTRLAVPPPGRLYHGVYPGGFDGSEAAVTPQNLAAYERAVGREVAWVYFSSEWGQSRAFPAGVARWVRERGAVPYIRLMLRADNCENCAEPTFTLSAVADGAFDADLRAWADAARSFGTPLLVEYGTEVNGSWFQWNGEHNAPGGAAKFRRAYRHVVQLMRARGANNISWVFHVAAQDDPETPENRFEAYYPGSDVVDWLGVSVYGAQTPTEAPPPSFAAQLDEAAPRLAKLAPGKPLLVAEFGMTANHPAARAAPWAQAALSALAGGRWPNVRGFAWWNEDWTNDDDARHNSKMRVQNVPDLAAVFRAKLGGPWVLDRPLFTR